MKKSFYLSVVAFILSVAAVAKVYLPCSKTMPVKPFAPAPVMQDGNVVTKDNIAEILVNNPKMIIDALQQYEMNMREEAARNANAVIEENVDSLNNFVGAPVLGDENSKVVMVQFFDYACGYCARLHDTANKLVADNKDVKFVHLPLAFVSQYSDYAGRAAIAGAKQGKFAATNDALFVAVSKGLSEESIQNAAKEAGLDMDKFMTDVESEEVKGIMSGINQLASTVQVSGVPTIIVDGKLLQTLDPAQIQAAIDNAKK